MEPTAFENSSVSDSQGLSQNVSAEPFCNLNTGSKFNTEEFLRHESGFTESEKPHGRELSPASTSDKIESVILQSDLIPDTDNFRVMESSGENVKPHTETNQDPNLTAPSGESHLIKPNVDDSITHLGDISEGKSDNDNNSTVNNATDSNSTVHNDPDNNSAVISDASQQVKQNTGEGNSLSVNVDSFIKNPDVAPQSEVKSSSDQEPNEKVEEEIKEEKEEWMDILGSGHLLKKVLKPGEPDSRPNKSDLCVISYTGELEDGTVVESAENIKIHLSDNEVVQGIDFALALMEKGEEAELKVGPRFAYGTLGKQPNIPAGATIMYKIKLLDVQEDPPINTLPINERISFGQKKKERGNFWYSREEHSIAINCYRRALEFLDDTDIPEPHNEEDVRKLIDERLKTYNNLTASQMKIHAYDAALMSVNYVLASQPQNIKALFRKSKILKEKGDIPEAIKVVRLALSFDKDSKSLQQELSSLLAVQRKDNSKQRELYKKMLGTNASQDKDGKGKASRSTYSTIKWTSLLAFAAVVVAGTVALKYKM